MNTELQVCSDSILNKKGLLSAEDTEEQPWQEGAGALHLQLSMDREQRQAQGWDSPSIPASMSRYSCSMGLTVHLGTALCPLCLAGNALGRAQEDLECGFSQQQEMVLLENHLRATSPVLSD